MKNICVTGYGVIAPQATNSEEFKNVLQSDKQGFTSISHPYSEEKSIVVGKVDVDEFSYLEPEFMKLPRAARLSIIAAKEAVEMAELQGLEALDTNFGIVIGTASGVLQEVESIKKKAVELGLKKLRPTSIGSLNDNSISTALSSYFHLHGPSFTICNSCTSGIDAILLAKALIESGQIQGAIVGGVDLALSDLVVAGFTKLNTLMTTSSSEKPIGPFSGVNEFVLSEGVGVLVLESEEFAKNRQVNILGYIEAGAMSQDAISIYKSDPSGDYLYKLIQNVVEEKEISYVNSQALGLLENDRIEKRICEELFQCKVPITSIKGVLGHSLGASGILQCISALMSIVEGFIPPTIGRIDSQFSHLPIVRELTTSAVHRVLLTAHGYGGNNACLLVSRKP